MTDKNPQSEGWRYGRGQLKRCSPSINVDSDLDNYSLVELGFDPGPDSFTLCIYKVNSKVAYCLSTTSYFGQNQLEKIFDRRRPGANPKMDATCRRG